MRLSAPLLGTIFLLVLPLPTTATYADEAYTNDFHHALLGTPQSQTTFFHRPSAASKASLLYTLSEKLVLGAINPKDGSVVWRQRLSARNGSTGGGHLKAGEAGTVIGSANDEVQAWDAADGRLAWGWQGAGSVKGLEVLEGGGQSGVLVFSEEEISRTVVRKLAADSGKVEWEHTEVRWVVEVTPFRDCRSSWADVVKWRPTFRTLVILRQGLQYLPALSTVEGLQNQGDSLRHNDWQARDPAYPELG